MHTMRGMLGKKGEKFAGAPNNSMIPQDTPWTFRRLPLLQLNGMILPTARGRFQTPALDVSHAKAGLARN
jgi:hypothetical protein